MSLCSAQEETGCETRARPHCRAAAAPSRALAAPTPRRPAGARPHAGSGKRGLCGAPGDPTGGEGRRRDGSCDPRYSNGPFLALLEQTERTAKHEESRGEPPPPPSHTPESSRHGVRSFPLLPGERGTRPRSASGCRCRCPQGACCPLGPRPSLHSCHLRRAGCEAYLGQRVRRDPPTNGAGCRDKGLGWKTLAWGVGRHLAGRGETKALEEAIRRSRAWVRTTPHSPSCSAALVWP